MFANISDKHFITVSAAIAGFKAVIDNYIFSDWQFAIFLVTMVAVDTILGVYKAWKSKSLESRAYSRVIEKILLYGAVLIMASVLIRFPVSGKVTGLFDWADDVLLLRP